MKKLILFLVIVLPWTGRAEIYQYLDENGRKVFTDKPPEETGLADKEIREDEAEKLAIFCANLNEELANKSYQRRKIKDNVNRAFYLDSQIRVIEDKIAESCETQISRKQ